MNKDMLRRLFPGLEEELYEEMLLHGVIRYAKEGDTLLRTGQNIRSTILILEGIVKLYREDNEGNEFFIYHLNAGQACSLSMVCSYRQETSEVMARAVTDAMLLTIPLEFMNKWMSRYKSWYEFVISSYRNRFEELLQTIDAVAFTNMDERLEFYLKKQVSQFGPNLKLTHQDIANDLNSSREVISRLLKKMEAKKFLLLHRNSIEWLGKVNARV
ncbi:MAG TPA: Crp/Fnr family transcriptional regulator [Parafilimonas sp.]|nr:Crp/Fnr family transcriptional regulator [Parafilimonas sp.]